MFLSTQRFVTAAAAATYSDSAVDNATVDCFLDIQLTRFPVQNTAAPLTLLRSLLSPAQSASEKASNGVFSILLFRVHQLDNAYIYSRSL
ncbi:hypothetical protein evm_000645 [Chilo suppressalis]|nr:hypothetical protein evm_000645 [Chilo suppressalis]